MTKPASSATALTFHDTTFHPIVRAGQPWLTASEIAAALGYAREDSISRIYDRRKDEFTAAMSETVNLTVSGNLQNEARIFSLRGAHLLGMFARTPRAAEFRRWVLDILDRETSEQPPTGGPSMIGRRWLVSIDHTGAERVTPVPDDACVMTQARMLKALVEPNGLMVDTDELAEFIVAATRRLQQRCEYHAARAAGKPVKLRM